MKEKKQIKKQISDTLSKFAHGNLADHVRELLQVLGYTSDRTLPLPEPTAAAFIEQFCQERPFNFEAAKVKDWQFIDLVFQLTQDDLKKAPTPLLLTDTPRVDDTIIESYLFFALELQSHPLSRSELSTITREINKLFAIPVFIIFKHDSSLTLAIIHRRLHKRDETRDVLEKVTLIKDINYTQPHRAHIEILFDLSLPQLQKIYKIKTFVELHQAWQKTLDCSELNNKFFQEISDWYFWARQHVCFPPDAPKDEEGYDAISLIRLITRLIFVWFLKEKGHNLIPEELFRPDTLKELINLEDDDSSTYYKAILQNLFFATLNQEMNTPEKPDNRKFRSKAKNGGRDGHYLIHNVYRYEKLFQNPQRALELFAQIPFLNGGLFECLDSPDTNNSQVNNLKKVLRIDGFSDREDNPLKVPNFLFFAEEKQVDLNAAYGTKNKKYRVRGLIHIFNRYKFTITENTPLEEEIALDPELLGQVFENLLATYNPETKKTARKQTGSFYTPREVVDYIVTESLILYLEQTLGKPDVRDKLRQLLDYNNPHNPFANDAETTQRLIAAIDNLKVLDPAVGSGAFPMGMLQKLVLVLRKLDPNNILWKQQQKEREIAPLLQDLQQAQQINYEQARQAAIAQLEERLREIEAQFANNEMDYARKLFLIENCIYGVDIQPIAVQIAKLRFFISLIVEQRVDDTAPNRGILPLPNLETKFLAANTLMGINRPPQITLGEYFIKEKEKELAEIRHRIFTARTPATKNKYRQKDKELRQEIANLLKQQGWTDDVATQLAQWDPYDQNTSASFFDPKWMFGVHQGFDVVMGNPPYVRQEQIKHLKEQLKSQYEFYEGTADLYVYFYERGLKLLKEGGILSYISSNTYFRADYGKKLRQFLSQHTRIHQIIDFGDTGIFTATVLPAIVVLEKTNPGNQAQFHALNWPQKHPLEDFATVVHQLMFTMPQKALLTGWQLAGQAERQLLEKLRQAGTPLGEYVNGRFYRGILTGLNEAFVVERATRDRLIAEDPFSAELLKPFLRGRDVKRWRVDYQDLWLIKIESSENINHPWTQESNLHKAEKIFAKTYPAIYEYFLQFRESLIKRSDQGKFFWELRSCAYWQEFERSKIIYPNICNRNTFTWDDLGFYANQKTFIIPNGSKYLLGVLNSSVSMWLFSQTLAKLQNGFYEPSKIFMEKIPIPLVNDADKQAIEMLVQKCLDAKGENCKAYEAEIDERVARLYGLTAEELNLIKDLP